MIYYKYMVRPVNKTKSKEIKRIEGGVEEIKRREGGVEEIKRIEGGVEEIKRNK